MKSKLILVELGRLVELQTSNRRLRWNKKDNWILACNVSGNRLFCFPRPRKTTDTVATDNSKKLFKIFNHHPADEILAGKICDAGIRDGRAISITYHSDKFGRASNYIHSFDTPPITWVNNKKNPKVIKLTGGHIKITARGIEG